MAVSAASALIHERAGHPHLQYLTQQQGTQAAVGVKKIERVNNIFYSLLASVLHIPDERGSLVGILVHDTLDI